MPLEIVLFTLLHLLVFAYWLGGDVGVFYASTLLTDAERDVPGRLAAAKIVNDVDLAPRICLLLAFPTGFALAAAKRWVDVDPLWVALAFFAAVAWIWLLLRLHHSPAAGGLRRLDLALRMALLAALVAAGAGALAGAIALPAFLAWKLLLLAFAVAMGLAVRRALKPFGPALAKLAGGSADPAVNETIARSMRAARPFVVLIWAALAVAAWLGIAMPG